MNEEYSEFLIFFSCKMYCFCVILEHCHTPLKMYHVSLFEYFIIQYTFPKISTVFSLILNLLRVCNTKFLETYIFKLIKSFGVFVTPTALTPIYCWSFMLIASWQVSKKNTFSKVYVKFKVRKIFVKSIFISKFNSYEILIP